MKEHLTVTEDKCVLIPQGPQEMSDFIPQQCRAGNAILDFIFPEIERDYVLPSKCRKGN